MSRLYIDPDEWARCKYERGLASDRAAAHDLGVDQSGLSAVLRGERRAGTVLLSAIYAKWGRDFDRLVRVADDDQPSDEAAVRA